MIKNGCLIFNDKLKFYNIFAKMYDTELPLQMRYQRIIPKGFPCIFKQWDLSPVTGNRNWISTDIIRFNFSNNSMGVLDRLRSYIQITVSAAVEQNPIGLLQVDNSAQSFINSMVLYSDNAQIQRIHQYGPLAAYLNDCGLNQFITQGRQQQGMGYGSFDTMPFGKPGDGHSTIALKDNLLGSYQSDGLIKPHMPKVFVNDDTTTYGRFAAHKLVRKNVTGLNSILFPDTLSGGGFDSGMKLWVKSYNHHGYYMNMRGQYLSNFYKTNFIQSTSSIPCYQLNLAKSVFIQGGYSSTTYKAPQNINGTIVYQTTVPDTVSQLLFAGSIAGTEIQQHALTTSNYGYANLFSPAFARGTFQPFISPTVRQSMLQNGRILPTKIPLKARKFKIPLLSSVIGVLVDESQFTLIPLRAINNSILQLTMDNHAMFSSGYRDISQGDISGMSYQQNRQYYIQNIQYKLHTYHYIESQIQTYIQTSLYKQIHLTTNFWILSGQYKVAANQGPQNSYNVSCKVTNLNQIVSLFLSADFQKYSFCRKNYRLSNNITQFYCKVGTDYFPPQPIRGNAGNPSSQTLLDDNSVFIENIYFASGYMFSSVPLPRINCYNFALNQRPYNVHNRQPYYSTQMVNGKQNFIFGAQTINADTALGSCWIHQNRCVGKAAFVINFSPYTKENTILKGINVSGVQDFQVCFETSGLNVYENDQLHLIFARVSGLVKYSQNKIQTFGR